MSERVPSESDTAESYSSKDANLMRRVSTHGNDMRSWRMPFEVDFTMHHLYINRLLTPTAKRCGLKIPIYGQLLRFSSDLVPDVFLQVFFNIFRVTFN